MADQLRAFTYDRVLAEGRVWIGDPDRVAAQVAEMSQRFGDVEPSILANFAGIPFDRARRTIDLLGRAVLPACA